MIPRHSVRTAVFVITSLAGTLCGQDWTTVGNAGTSADVNFVGTTDNVPLQLRANNTRGLLLTYALVSNQLSVNVTLGAPANLVRSGAFSGTVGGGGYFVNGLASITRNAVHAHGGTVAGGVGNSVGSESASLEEGQYGAVSGGRFNSALGSNAMVAGGESNIARGKWSFVAGGSGNIAGGEYSFAGGRSAFVRRASDTSDADGDQGTFVWSDAIGTSFASTGPNQFLVRATGGVGVGTNTPGGALDVRTDSNVLFPQVMLTEPGSDFARLSFRSGTAGRYFTIAGSTGNANAADDRLNFYHSTARDVVTINGAGRVGIGTSNPGAFRLAVAGEAAKPGGGSWAVFCDSRLKDNIEPLSGTLDRLMELRGYTFDYKPEAVANNFALPGKQVGLIAEEVERVFPQWVQRDEAGYMFVTERATTALMVEGLRDLRAEKDAQIAALGRENALLKERLAKIELMLAK